jgi:hypothetical protein
VERGVGGLVEQRGGGHVPDGERVVGDRDTLRPVRRATAGNMLRWGALTTSKTVGNGDTPSFGIGTLVLTED